MRSKVEKWTLPISLKKEIWRLGTPVTRIRYTAEFDVRGLYRGLWEDYLSNIEKKGIEKWTSFKINYQREIFESKINDSIKEYFEIPENMFYNKDKNIYGYSAIPLSGFPDFCFGVGSIEIHTTEKIPEEVIIEGIKYSMFSIAQKLIYDFTENFDIKNSKENSEKMSDIDEFIFKNIFVEIEQI
mgnify:CR=1 FL=1